MYTLIVQNEREETLTLTDNKNYTITEIDGLNPPDATINTSRLATTDGTEYNSSYVGEREITITLAINSPAEENRINLYRYLRTKRKVRLFYTNEHREVYIDGYVQKIDIQFFAIKQIAQITIICPAPFFNGCDAEIVEFSNIEPMFEFPFVIEKEGIPFSALIPSVQKIITNLGDLDTGITISLHATGDVKTPKIYNIDTKQFFIVNTTLKEGDEITITTKVREKNVSLLRNGEKTNLIGFIKQGSTWFQLSPGESLFTYEADEGVENLSCKISLISQYEGV